MKSETKIAEENIETKEKYKNKSNNLAVNFPAWIVCKSHKESCQRFLDYLCCMYKEDTPNSLINKDKITDLKNAIKKYVEAGI